jgi:hypothetical protein
MERTLLYLIYSPALKAFKVGISNLSNKRYSQHRIKGWRIVKYWYFESRQEALRVESGILSTLRNKFPKVHLKKDDMPQHGYTEAFSSEKISSRKVIKLIEKEIN